MSLKEQFTNTKLIIQNDRKVWAIGGAIVLILVVWMFSNKETRTSYIPTGGTGQTSSQQTTGQATAFNDLVTGLKQKVDKVASTTEEQGKSLERTISDYQRDRKQFQGIFESVADRLDSVDRSISELGKSIEDLRNRADRDMTVDPVLSGTMAGSETFGFEVNTVPPPPAPPQPLKMTFISPGDTVPVKLLTGVNAPVDGTPYPVLFQLKGPITGPDGTSLDLGEARVIAAATGSETDARVLYRLSDLSLRHRDGRRSIVKVDGWVVGEDGIRGTSGKLVDKLGRLILATAGISYTAALGERLTDKADNLDISNSENVSITAEDMDFASASAFYDASNRLGKILLDRYEKLVPVVEVLSGREVVAVFSAPAEVEVIDEEGDEGIYAGTAID